MLTPDWAARRHVISEPGEVGDDRKQMRADGGCCVKHRARATERKARRCFKDTGGNPPDHQWTQAPPRAAARTAGTAESEHEPLPPKPKAENTVKRESM